MLSPQTKDEVCDAAVKKVRIAIGGTLSVDAMIQAEESTVAEAVNKVGFWRKKAVYVSDSSSNC
jgi:endonuclease III